MMNISCESHSAFFVLIARIEFSLSLCGDSLRPGRMEGMGWVWMPMLGRVWRLVVMRSCEAYMVSSHVECAASLGNVCTYA